MCVWGGGLTSVSSINLKTTSGAAAVPKTSVLIFNFGFALRYRVACICLQISLADDVRLSRGLNRISTVFTNRNSCELASFVNFIGMMLIKHSNALIGNFNWKSSGYSARKK